MLVNLGEVRPARKRKSQYHRDTLALGDLPCLRSGITEDHTASYFSHSDDKASQLREALAEECLESLIAWLKKGGNVAIHGMYADQVGAIWWMTFMVQMRQTVLKQGGKPRAFQPSLSALNLLNMKRKNCCPCCERAWTGSLVPGKLLRRSSRYSGKHRSQSFVWGSGL